MTSCPGFNQLFIKLRDFFTHPAIELLRGIESVRQLGYRLPGDMENSVAISRLCSPKGKLLLHARYSLLSGFRGAWLVCQTRFMTAPISNQSPPPPVQGRPQA